MDKIRLSYLFKYTWDCSIQSRGVIQKTLLKVIDVGWPPVQKQAAALEERIDPVIRPNVSKITEVERNIETNIKGTEIVLELADKKKKKVMLASTSEIYGKSANIPLFVEARLAINPDGSLVVNSQQETNISAKLIKSSLNETRQPSQ